MNIVTLTACQEKALVKLNKFLDSPKTMFVVGGPAGSGKTFLIQYFLQQHPTYCVIKLAPTHQSKQVLQRSLTAGKVATTIASFFKLTSVIHPETLQEEYRIPGDWHPVDKVTGMRIQDLQGIPKTRYRWEYTESHSPVNTMVQEAHKAGTSLLFVIDEISMIGKVDYARLMEMFSSVLSKLPNSKMILLGDDKQLPPVAEEASPFFTMAYLRRADVGKCQLKEIVRTKDADIKTSLEYVRSCIDGQQPIDLQMLQYGKNFLRCTNLSEHFEHFLSEKTGSVRILAFRNVTVDKYNLALREKIHGERSSEPGRGDLVMFTRPYVSPTGVRVHNSDTARILSVKEVYQALDDAGAGHRFSMLRYEMEQINLPEDAKDREFLCYKFIDPAAFDKEVKAAKARVSAETDVSRRKKMIEEDLRRVRCHHASFKLCFSQTVHKSQGESLDIVLLDADDVLKCNDTNTRNKLFYTAMSRAKKLLVMKLT